MASSRLSVALNEGYFSPERGKKILVVGPAPDFDLSDLNPDDIVIVQSFKPYFDHWIARGYDVQTEFSAAQSAIICLQKSRRQNLDLISQATKHVAAGGQIAVDGSKKDGILAVLKSLKSWSNVGPAVSKSHGKLVVIKSSPAPVDWVDVQVEVEGYKTALGGFSETQIDKGSQALIDVLPKLKGDVADFGAGWGYVSAHILRSQSVTSIDLIEAFKPSLNAAQANISDPRARFEWADVTTLGSDRGYKTIVSNPPFHVTHKSDADIGRAFIAAAARCLSASGTFFMVANRHLPYESHLRSFFGRVEELSGTPAFKVFAARKPKTKPGLNHG